MVFLSLLWSLTVLPERIDLKTPTASFGTEYDLAVHEGRLYWRRRTGSLREWELVPPNGLPVGRGGALQRAKKSMGLANSAFDSPERIDALSADGDNLVAWGADGRVYYTKLKTLEWTNVWGPMGGEGPLFVSGLDSVAMSHRMVAYEDIDGNSHPVTAGVTTFYALANQGRSLRFADPWLPPHFERTICLPERNQFVATALSASASSLFVMDSVGHSYTRLVDFDTQGDDPALPYSWVRERRTGARKDVRSLPAEEWKEQPRVPGWHSSHITIVQTGPTNAGRELRVEGQGGYWVKAIDEATWRFEKTGVEASGVEVSDGPSPRQPSGALALSESRAWPKATVTLHEFDPVCSPARLEIVSDDEQLALELHFHRGLQVISFRGVSRYSGAVLLPAGDSRWLKRLRGLAMGASHLDVIIEVSASKVVVKRPPLVSLEFARAP